MPPALQPHKLAFNSNELLPLLNQYQMLPQLMRECILDEAIVDIRYSDVELAAARQHYYQTHQLLTEYQQHQWCEQHYLSPSKLDDIATRSLRIEKFKQATWGHRLENYFLKRKAQLDQVIYSLLRTPDFETAYELYFRIAEGEQSFHEVAKAYSQGPEARTGGICGPAEMGVLPNVLGQCLAIAQPGQLSQPFQLGEWYVVVRLEERLPAQLTEAMRQRLLNELFESWMQAELKKHHL